MVRSKPNLGALHIPFRTSSFQPQEVKDVWWTSFIKEADLLYTPFAIFWRFLPSRRSCCPSWCYGSSFCNWLQTDREGENPLSVNESRGTEAPRHRGHSEVLLYCYPVSVLARLHLAGPTLTSEACTKVPLTPRQPALRSFWVS